MKRVQVFLHPTFFMRIQAAANCAPDASCEIERPSSADRRDKEPEIAARPDAVSCRKTGEAM
jgi:hypothetical protein